MSSFRVGQKVVCVDEIPDIGRRWANVGPIKGNIYTIKKLTVGPYSGKPCANFEGLNNGFPIRWDRFRPLITPEQDIALFHALCPGLPVVPPAVLKPRVTAADHQRKMLWLEYNRQNPTTPSGLPD